MCVRLPSLLPSYLFLAYSCVPFCGTLYRKRIYHITVHLSNSSRQYVQLSNPIFAAYIAPRVEYKHVLHNLHNDGGVRSRMAESLRLFVSATRDLEPQRAVIGRAVADLPVRVTIEIRRTPPERSTPETIFDLIANCDRVYVLLGRDISAPVGNEWDVARHLDRPILALRADVPMTPAAREFLRFSQAEWKTFHSDTELARLIALDVIDLLLHPLNRYGLTPDEVDQLLAYRRELAPERVATGEPGGAEGGAVLLDDRRREPLRGRLLTETPVERAEG